MILYPTEYAFLSMRFYDNAVMSTYTRARNHRRPRDLSHGLCWYDALAGLRRNCFETALKSIYSSHPSSGHSTSQTKRQQFRTLSQEDRLFTQNQLSYAKPHCSATSTPLFMTSYSRSVMLHFPHNSHHRPSSRSAYYEVALVN